ncbi:alanine--glyoxylate aminotransferase 2, mitochondrial isoform X1 [Octopus bimaculoides]|nr:alanine--glyoxylate aminotransferase 2, mitochondrial isoform X1 [Octopus bimaculoides]
MKLEKILNKSLRLCKLQVRYQHNQPVHNVNQARVSMPSCDFVPKPYQGISAEAAKTVRQYNINPALFTFYKNPVFIYKGHMQWLWDTNGKRYLDCFGGIVTISAGHCHPAVVEAAEKQLNDLWHTTNIYLHPTLHQYASELVAKLPGDLKVVYFTNSGSEANDLAMFMARMYTGTFEIIGLRNAYHGASPYLMGLTALGTWRYNVPTGFGIHQTMNPDPYRGVWGGAHCRDSPVQTTRTCDCPADKCLATDLYIDQLQDVLSYSMPKGRAGCFFAESMQGVGGTVQFTKGYIKRAFEMIREKGGLCISDEVQTGFGRTGTHFWGFEGHDVIPDIVTMAKGMGNGFPLAAVVTTPAVAKKMSEALHFNTFGGNPLSCAVGSAVLKVIEEENLQENCHVIGTYFLTELAKLRDEFEVIGDVRGKGLMIGVEMVTDKESKTPLPAEHFAHIWERTKDLGVLLGKGGFFGNVLRIKPPMCITKTDVDFTVDVLRQSLVGYEKGIKSN